jgi:hypothetical protein
MEHLLAGSRTWRELEENGADLGESSNAFWTFATTDQDGRFELGGLLEREYRLKAMDRATLTHAVGEPVHAGATGVELVLAREGRRELTGLVVSTGGFPLEGARVLLSHRAARASVGTTTVSWDVEGPETYTDDTGRFSFPRAPLTGVKLIVSGDGFRAAVVEPEEVDAAGDLTVRVELSADRCYFRVELADPGLADRFELLGAGGPAELEFRRGGYATSTSQAGLTEGVSFVLAVPEGSYELALFDGEVEVSRERVSLVPGEVTVLRR